MDDIFTYLDKSILQGILEVPENLGELRKAIRFKNKDIFEKEIKEKIIERGLNKKELLNQERLNLIIGSKVNFQIAGYHYISFSQGSWFRLIGIREESELSKTEDEYYEEIRNRVPKESNLFTSNALVKPIRIQFGGNQQQNSILYLSKSNWDELKKNLRNVNLLKYVAGLPIDEKDKNKDDKIIGDLVKKLNNFLEEFYQRLKESFLEERIKQFDNLNSEEKYRRLLELFVFSLFSSIYIKIDDNKKPLHVIIIPYKMEYKEVNIPEIVKYATFGGAYHTEDDNPLNDNQIDKLARYLQILPLYILAQEYSVSWDIIQPSTLIVEDVIRQCTSVDISENAAEVQNCVNRWQKRFEVWLSYYNGGDSFPEKGDLEKIKKELRGYSDKYLSLIENTGHAVKAGLVISDDKSILKPTFIFIYSEPGCGKEKIAKILHLLSYRAGRDDILKNTFSEQKRTNKLLYKKFKNLLKADKRFFCWREKENHLNFSELKNKLFFNYFTYNCSYLTEENYKEELFGSLREDNTSCGLFLKAHLLCGTVFLDEFSTMKFQIVNKLLRIFDEPYEIYLEGYPTPIRLNPMVILASNKKRDELIKERFNPALIDRITRSYFSVPPLRERPEDIAVFVNYLIWEYNKEREERQEEKIQYFDLPALRLICELPWKDNYRGVQGLIEDIISNRKRRELTTKKISFEEVIDSLKRKELIGKKIDV